MVMTSKIVKYRTPMIWLAVGITALTVMLSPMLTQAIVIDEKTIRETIGIVQEGPSPQDVPNIVDEWPFTPREQAIPTGKAQLKATNLFGVPDKYNRINLQSAIWLQDIIDTPGKYIDLPEQSKTAYFGYYNSVQNNMAYFEVTYPDGTVQYYHIEYHEVP